MSVINNDYQTALLFKRFTGVAATQLNSQFSNEPFRAIVNIFSRDVFIEDIPNQAPISIYNLDNSTNWVDSDASGNPSDISGSGGTFASLYPDSKLQFYKNIELEAVPGSQSRVWRKLDSDGNNILRDCINFKYDDVNSTYLMRIKYSTNGTTYLNNPINSWPLFWVLDNQSGYLQFYSTTGDLASNANIPTNPPKISFFKYNGKKGITNLDVSGQQQVADISGIDTMLNSIHRMILPDGYVDISGGAPYDLCGNEVVRTYYQYTRKKTFIGYPNLPVLDGSAVDHSQDPSRNIVGISNNSFDLDVSGSCYVSHKIIVGPSGGFFIESVSGEVHTIGSGEYGDMEFSTSNHLAIHVPQQQNAFFVASSGSVGVGTAAPSAKLEVSGNTLMRGELDMSCNDIVDVSRISFCTGGRLDMSCNNISDVGNIHFCDGLFMGPSGSFFEIKSYSPGKAIYIESEGNNHVYVENVNFSSNTIRSIGYISFSGNSAQSPGIRWAGGSETTGIYEPYDAAVGITCSGEAIATFSHNDISGIQFYRDVSMNANKIYNINDATDNSGVPSWGQVQNLVISGGGSYWTQSGTDLYYNVGNVGIGTATPSQALEISGTIALWQDMSMNGGQIVFIGNATDPSGVPSWGQVQTAMIDLSNSIVSSHWDLSGTDLYYNTGNVGIGTANPAVKLNIIGNSFITGDISTNRIITYENNDFAIQSYIRITSVLQATRPPIEPLESNMLQKERYDASQYPSNADPNNKVGNGTTVLVPIAICPVSMQQWQAALTIGTQPNLGFNVCAYFTLKLYDGTALNSRYVPATPMLGRSSPLQQIHFIAGLINKDDSEGGGALIYEKIPFIKVLSNINLGRGLTAHGRYSQLPYYIDALELWEDQTDLFSTIGQQAPYVPANGTTYLMLRLSADINAQVGPSPPQSLFSDFNCYYDVRMYKNNTGLNDTISNNVPSTPNVQPNDWNLLTPYQQLWLLGNSHCTTAPDAWREMFNNNNIPPVPINYTLDQFSGTYTSDPGHGNWFGNLFAVYNGVPSDVTIKHLETADVSLNIWLEEPYGITNTKEVFLDEVRCYSSVDICGNTTAQNISAKDITCNNIDVNTSIDVGASQELRIIQSNITSTTASTNFYTGFIMEAENFYHKINTPGIGSGFIVNLNDTTDNKMFRIMTDNTNLSDDTIFSVGGGGQTATRDIVPLADLSYNIGYDQGPGSAPSNRLRFKQLHIGDISCSFTIDTSGDLIVKGKGYFKNDVDICGNVNIDGEVDICGNVGIDGNVDICGNVGIDGNVTIGGHLNINDLSANNIDISNDLNVGGILTADTIKNIDLSGTKIDLAATGMFRLKDNNTGAASNHVIVARADNNEVNFGGYDYTGGVGIIGTPTARDRVIVDLKAGATQFGLLVADSGSVIQTLGGIKILPLQSNANGAPPNYVSPGWGASLFLGQWGWGNQNWNDATTIRFSQWTRGENLPGSGNVYCNAVRQNIVYTDLNVQGPTWSPGWQGVSFGSMYYNQGDIRYIIVDPINGSSNYAQVSLPEIFTPMLGQAITVARTNVPTTYTQHKTAVYVQATGTNRINCPSSIFIDGGGFGGIALDPYNDISGNSSVVLPVPYKGTEICSVTLVASQNGYYTDIPNSSGEPQGGDITSQFVWQFISSGSPGI